eukprot:COSAG01_NODE_2372_length_7810_cov_5.360135_1_plen_87_part_10
MKKQTLYIGLFLLLTCVYPATILKAELSITENSQQQIIASNGTHTWTINKGTGADGKSLNNIVKIENNQIIMDTHGELLTIDYGEII